LPHISRPTNNVFLSSHPAAISVIVSSRNQ
jgi:hypothetical protein